MLRASVLGSNTLPKDAEKYFDQIQLFRDMMMRYQCAMLEVQTKLQVLNNDMAVRYQRNPIEAIKTRIKDPISIVEKMKRRGLNITVGNMVRNLNDVAGIRVICSFIDDIYEVARMLSYDSRDPGVFLGQDNEHACRGADTDHSDGFLGKP